MGISRKQYRLLAQAGMTKQGAKMLLDSAGDEKDPTTAYDKIATVLAGGVAHSTLTYADDGVKPIEKEISETQPKKTRTPRATAKKELKERIELNYRKFEDVESIEKALREEIGVKYVSLQEFGTEKANQYAEGIYDMVKKFPNLRDHIKYFSGMKSFFKNLDSDLGILDTVKETVLKESKLPENKEELLNKLSNPLSKEIFQNMSKDIFSKDWDRAMATSAVLNYLKEDMEESLNRTNQRTGKKVIDTLGGRFYVFTKEDGLNAFFDVRPKVKDREGFDGVVFNDVADLEGLYVPGAEMNKMSPTIAKYPDKLNKYLATHELSHILDMKLLREYGERQGKRSNVAEGRLWSNRQLLGISTLEPGVSRTNLDEIVIKNMPTKEQLVKQAKKYYNTIMLENQGQNVSIDKFEVYEKNILTEFDNFQQNGKVGSFLKRLTVREYVGDYANKNIEELFAESLAQVMIDEQPSQFAKDIVNAVIGPGGYTI